MIASLGTCAIYKRLGCYPAANCTVCDWYAEAIYEDDLARRVAEHSRTHAEAVQIGQLQNHVDRPQPEGTVPSAPLPADYARRLRGYARRLRNADREPIEVIPAEYADALADALDERGRLQEVVEQVRRLLDCPASQATNRRLAVADVDRLQPEGTVPSARPVTFGPAQGWPVEVECECGWFASGRGFDATDAAGVGRQLLRQHRDKTGHAGPTEVNEQEASRD